MKYMRIVARSAYNVHVQFSDRKRDGYTQKILSHEEFFDLMVKEYPHYFAEFKNEFKNEFTDLFYICAKYFYHYGETRDMIRSGEAYIFEGGYNHDN